MSGWTDLEEAVYQTVGAASMCWEHVEKAGEFKSDRAREIGRELIDWLTDWRDNEVTNAVYEDRAGDDL